MELHNKLNLNEKEVSIIDLKLPAASPLSDSEDMPAGYSLSMHVKLVNFY
tara:strand:- start:118 stop:267 length:150 start_codon:yes stop_codon:yes gene_type:complete